MYWGDSPKMRELRSIVQKVARTDAGILITGENGTGKDMLAGEIHRMSRRSGNSMVCVDVGSLPESLFESESPMPALTGPASSRWLPGVHCFWTR